MKKALKINLSGQIFHIDEDAYDRLKIYLDTISSHFSNIEEGKEIIADIEFRIAEILEDKAGDESKIITIADVDKVIDIMGRPEEIISEDDTSSSSQYHNPRKSRRLYRDPDNAVLGGVAAGLGAYFNIDVVVLRVLFVVLILMGMGFPFLLYIILWIAVPKANTIAEKLEMKGEKINVSNLEKKMREEYEEVKTNFKKARDSDFGRNTESFFHTFFRVLGRIIIVFLKIIIALIALSFIIAGLGLVTGIIGFAFFGSHMLPFIGEFLLPFFNPVSTSIAAISATLIILIPILAIIYGLLKILFRFKAKDRALGTSALALWILALISLITLTITEGKNYTKSESISIESTFENSTTDTLYLEINEKERLKFKGKGEFEINRRDYYIGKDDNLYGEVDVNIEKSPTSMYQVEIIKDSRGSDYEDARRLAESIRYDFSRNDSLMVLNPYFKTDMSNKWRAQAVKIIIRIPENKAVNINKNLSSFLKGYGNSGTIPGYRMAGKTWVMHEEGLESK